MQLAFCDFDRKRAWGLTNAPGPLLSKLEQTGRKLNCSSDPYEIPGLDTQRYWSALGASLRPAVKK